MRHRVKISIKIDNIDTLNFELVSNSKINEWEMNTAIIDEIKRQEAKKQ